MVGDTFMGLTKEIYDPALADPRIGLTDVVNRP
jgi:hypothetical protein